MGLGTASLFVTPLASVIACGSNAKTKSNYQHDVDQVANYFTNISVINIKKEVQQNELPFILTAKTFTDWGGQTLQSDGKTPFVFPTPTLGTTIKYKIDESLTKAGQTLLVTVSVIKGEGSAQAVKNTNFSFSWDQINQDALDVAKVKSSFEEVSVWGIGQKLDEVTKKTALNSNEIKRWGGQAWKYLYKYRVPFVFPSDTLGTTITYTTSASLTKAGDQATVNVLITKGSGNEKSSENMIFLIKW